MSLQLPIVQAADIVTAQMQYFQGAFKNINQVTHFKNYVTGLMVLPKKSMASISRSMVEGTNKSNLARFMSESPWDSAEVNKARVKMMREKTAEWQKEHSVRALILDDTLSKHAGEMFEHVSWHYDHTTGHSEEAHNMVNSYYVAGAVRFTVDFDFYRTYDEYTGWEGALRRLKPALEIPSNTKARKALYERNKEELLATDPVFAQRDAEFKTKIKIACELIDSACDTHNLKPTIALFDAWYLSPELLACLNKHHLNWISILKKNRNIECNSFELKDESGQPVRFEQATIQVQNWVKFIPPSAFKPTTLNNRTFYTFTMCVRIATLGKVRLVISYKNADLTGDYVVLVSNCLEWTVKKILEVYLLRWPIETFYQDSKQLLGLDQYQMLSAKAYKNHGCLVCVAHSLLHLECLAVTDKKATRPTQSIGAACRQQAMALLEHFVQYLHAFIAQGFSISEILPALLSKFLPAANSRSFSLPQRRT